MLLASILILLSPLTAAGFQCATSALPQRHSLEGVVAAKHVDIRTTGTRSALVLFAHFAQERPARDAVPEWATDIFNPQRPGSFSHFYAAMSSNRLRIDGDFAPRRYAAQQTAATYLAADPTVRGRFGQFSEEIIVQADADIDFSRFDNDGPDGLPDSGDDDGAVDALFIVLPSMPRNFLIGGATGLAVLGLGRPYETDDIGIDGRPIRIPTHHGSLLLGRDYAETVGTMCHEYGHHLGLSDLFNTDFLRSTDPGGPQNDSAGIGRWGLMGQGTLGWGHNDGPNSFSAWSRIELGWANVLEPERESAAVRLAPVGSSGQVYRIPFGDREFFLLENRLASASYYDRNIPSDGLLIWHVRQKEGLSVDLECADGRWSDAGFPLGRLADPVQGEDNLDYWAHDTAYATAHNGNLGDATDPFDGERFTAFTPQTNPSSAAFDGTFNSRVSVEGIHYQNDVIVARVQTAPASVRLEDLAVEGDQVDDLIVAGEAVRLHFRLVNQGGIPLQDLRLRIATDDPWIEVVHETTVETLAAGAAVYTKFLPGSSPTLRFTPNLTQPHSAEVSLEIWTGERLLIAVPLHLSALSFHRLHGRVTDEGGRPAPGVQLAARRRAAGGALYFASTDTAGRYEFVLPEGNYSLSIAQGVTADILLDRDKERVFTLPDLFQVRGNVLDPTDHNQNGILTFFPLGTELPPFSIDNTHNGYAAVLPPGRFRIALRHLVDAFEGTKDLGEILVQKSAEVHFDLPASFFVPGTLTDAQGRPIDDADIRGVSAVQSLSALPLTSDGAFFIKAVPGTYNIEVEAQGQSWPLGRHRLEKDRPFQLQLPAAYAELSGHLFDAAGARIARGDVMLVKDIADIAGALFHTRVQTDAAGAYQIRQVPGTYILLSGRYTDHRQRYWLGAVRTGLELLEPMQQDLGVPDLTPGNLVSGQIQYEAERPRTDVLLVFYDAVQGLLARAHVPADEARYDIPLPSGTYRVWARQHDPVGGIEKVYDLGRLAVSADRAWDAGLGASATAVTLNPTAAHSFELAQNYPNPFNSTTTIHYTLPQPQKTTLEIFNLAGQRIAILVDKLQPAGTHHVTWNGLDQAGKPVASGLYLYRLRSANRLQTRKLLLVR